MGVIYEPTGKAREFGDFACNLYKGCSHGCVYCYAPGVLRMGLDDFMKPVPRDGILEQLRKDMKKYKNSKTPIFLSFTSDPYQPLEMELEITRRALGIITGHGAAINVLTKGGRRTCRDFDILKKNSLNWLGATLTFSGLDSSLKYEPEADYPHIRIDTLRKAKAHGINTWMSLEPILAPADALANIQASLEFCDLYKIGKLNHRRDMGPSDDELREFLKEAVALLKENGKRYYIKLDTRPYLEPGVEAEG